MSRFRGITPNIDRKDIKMEDDSEKQRADKNLRGRSFRFGDVELRTHVLIFDGFKKDPKTGRVDSLITHEDPDVWAIEKYSRDEDGREYCYTLANVEFKDPSRQTEYDLKSVGNRLVSDIDASDLDGLKRIVGMLDEHCAYMEDISL